MFYIRLGLGIIMLGVAVEILRIMLTLKNRELITLAWRVGLSILGFALLRIVCGILDAFFGFEFAYLTTVATYGFWIATYAFFWHHRRVLQSEKVGDTGRENINKSVNDIAAEMRGVKKKLDRVLTQ